MAFIWRCRSRIRLRPNSEILSSLPTIRMYRSTNALIDRKGPNSRTSDTYSMSDIHRIPVKSKVNYPKDSNPFDRLLKPQKRIVSLKAVCHLVSQASINANIQGREHYLLQSILWLLKNVDMVQNDIKSDHKGWRPLISFQEMKERKAGMTKRRQDRSLDVVLSSILSTEIGLNHLENQASLIQSIAFIAHERSRDETLKMLAFKLESVLVPYLDADNAFNGRISSGQKANLSLLANAYTLTFSAYSNDQLSKQVYLKESLLWLAAQLQEDPTNRRITDFRPDILLLEASIWLEGQDDKTAVHRSDTENSEVVLSRLVKLEQDMAMRNIPIDSRWSMILITTLVRIVKEKTTSLNGHVGYDDLQPFLQLARKVFLQQAKQKHDSQHAMDDILFIHSILDMEMRVAMALNSERASVKLLSADHITQHLDWVSEVARRMAERNSLLLSDKTEVAPGRQSYWEDLVRLSTTKASSTTITLRLLCGNHEAAVEDLQLLIQQLAKLPTKDFKSGKNLTQQEKDSISQHLHRVERYKSLVRSTLINVLVSLCKKGRQLDKDDRNLIKKVVQIAQQSLEVGIWDMGRGYKFARTKLQSRQLEGNAFDFARLCARALSACSPVNLRGKNIEEGVEFRTIKGDEKAHCDDFFALLDLIIGIRSNATQRELAQILRNTTSENALSPHEPIVQPWRKAFREMFSLEKAHISRIILSSMAHFEDDEKESLLCENEKQQDPLFDQDTKLFLERFTIILNKVMIGFGLKRPCWDASEIVLKTMQDHIPSSEAREHAEKMRKSAYVQAEKNKFGAIVPSTKG